MILGGEAGTLTLDPHSQQSRFSSQSHGPKRFNRPEPVESSQAREAPSVSREAAPGGEPRPGGFCYHAAMDGDADK